MKDLSDPDQEGRIAGPPALKVPPALRPAGAGPGAAAPTTEYGVATVYVDRGNGPSRFATISAALGPMATTTSGHFRFSCSAAQAPCKVSLGAAVISPEGGTTQVVPEAHDPQAVRRRHADELCEYADGANNTVGFAEVSKVATASEAATR